MSDINRRHFHSQASSCWWELQASDTWAQRLYHQAFESAACGSQFRKGSRYEFPRASYVVTLYRQMDQYMQLCHYGTGCNTARYRQNARPSGRVVWDVGLGRLVAGIADRIPLGACMFVSCVRMSCCPVSIEAFAMSWSLVQRSPTPCLIRFRNPERASENVDRRYNPKKSEPEEVTRPSPSGWMRLQAKRICICHRMDFLGNVQL
jgi:hypothetical protein